MILTAEPAIRQVIRNPGIPLDRGWLAATRVNRSAIERRAETMVARRTVKKEWQAAWLLRAIALLDLTTLSGDDTAGTVRRLCAKAMYPLRTDMVEGLGIQDLHLQVAAVCVYHNLVPTAVEALKGSSIAVAAVSTGFPAGQIPLEAKLEDIRDSVSAGATEIDMVISRALVLSGEWQRLHDEVSLCRQACGNAHLKTILATGELGTLRNVAIASLVAMMAGADFIKTSTGKETVNATLPVGLVMVRMIREYWERSGHKVGFKAAGGIRTSRQALDWEIMVNEELGPDWLRPPLLRLGASGLLSDIERQLSHFLTGRYAAANHFPMP